MYIVLFIEIVVFAIFYFIYLFYISGQSHLYDLERMTKSKSSGMLMTSFFINGKQNQKPRHGRPLGHSISDQLKLPRFTFNQWKNTPEIVGTTFYKESPIKPQNVINTV